MRLLSTVRNFVVPPLVLFGLVVLWPVLVVLQGLGLLIARRRAFTTMASSSALTLSSSHETLEFPWTDIRSTTTDFLPPLLTVRIQTASHESKPLWVRDLPELERLLRAHDVPLHGRWPSTRLRLHD
jgi:hypothetical protein